MLRNLAVWLRSEARLGRNRRRMAHWLGRSWAHVSYGFRVEPTWLEVNQCEIPIASLPNEFDGFRIVQLSDFHCGRLVNGDYLTEAVELALDQNPDVVVLTGDFIHKGFKHIDEVAEIVGCLSAPCGVFAVLGNHDYSVRNALGFRRYRHLHRAVADALGAKGIRVLHNESVALRREEKVLQLIGVEDLWSRACDLDLAYHGLTREAPHIVLAHNPRTVEHLNGRRCDLMLSGHTHGGQIHVPRLGRPTLGPKTRRFAAGLYQLRDTYLYVNRGVGFGFRFRYGVRPEVTVLVLRTANGQLAS